VNVFYTHDQKYLFISDVLFTISELCQPTGGHLMLIPWPKDEGPYDLWHIYDSVVVTGPSCDHKSRHCETSL